MAKRLDRTTKVGVQLDQESRAWQRKQYLDALERDNFVARTEFEAIIATAEATAAVPGPATLNTTILDVAQGGATVGGQATTTMTSSISGGASSHQVGKRVRSSGGRNALGGDSIEAVKSNSRRGGRGRGGVSLPPTKPLKTLILESGIESHDPTEPSYLTADMGPSRYPARRLCSVCGWRGLYSCNRCGMRYCGLPCLKVHQDTRCMKLTV
ncbi:MAG: hypothetical protein JOS17DRAFT_437186 [Linnemannia elongata]|nr:MAG: hypothetical protein JOS17DRAFT_437186 [Linnemannia elongata]